MTEWLSEQEQAAWRGFLRMHSNLMTAMEQALKADSAMSMADYEVLVMLSEAPDAELRSRDLRFELQWDAARLTNDLEQLAQRELVRCEGTGGDTVVSLTEAGRAAIDAAAPAHVARVRRLFFDALTPEQVQVMDDAAAAVLENIARLGTEPGDV